MSLQETIDYYGRSVSGRYVAGKCCAFVPPVLTAGFIDTSAALDGSRGIAFLRDGICANLDGHKVTLLYADITAVQIIGEFESAYEDELSVRDAKQELRVHDCSLNKAALKRLIDALVRTQGGANIGAPKAPEEAQPTAAVVAEEAQPTAAQAPEDAQPTAAQAPEETRDNASKADEEAQEPAVEDVPVPVIAEQKMPGENVPPEHTAHEHAAHEPAAHEPAPSERSDDDLLPDGEIEAMSREQTLSFLASSISEINSAPEPDTPTKGAEAPTSPPTVNPETGLTQEPDWGDVYINASRSIREQCEGGYITMQRIEQELKERLIDTATAFVDIAKDPAKVPKILLPQIEELKAASDNLGQYFDLGEDVAARAMFFMMFQMLSYSDRIAETPETKERLNDFFRRWGAAGITLSMMDKR